MKFIAALVLLGCHAALVGAQNATTSGRIAYGSAAPKSSYPYVAYINMGEKQCSGVVVGSRWVLTAAHCGIGVTSVSTMRVHLSTTSAPSPSQVHRVRRKVVPNGFSSTTLYGDVMLLELDTPTKVAPVRLPRGAASLTPLEDGNEVTVAGYGATQASASSESLFYTTVAYDGSGACARGLQAGGPEDHLCFASPAQDGRATCIGDSGGPFLRITAEGPPLLVGIVSFGPDVKCGDKSNFDVATSVYYWAEWIARVMKTTTARRNSKRRGRRQLYK